MQPQFRQVPPSDRRALDDRGAQAELRGADGGDVAAGARANHDDVVFVRHLPVFLPIDDSGTNGHGGAGAGGRPRVRAEQLSSGSSRATCERRRV